jgi:tetratricopeptide (TPR) repeat protein
MKSAHPQTIITTLPKAVHIFLLAAIVFLAYGSNLDGAFIFDDSRIENNPALHITDISLDSLSRAALESSPKTRPVAHLSFALNYYFHGFDTRGYHLVNICIHALAAVIIFLFLETTLNLPPLRRRYGPGTWLAFGAALLWAVHPLQTQSVTYIIQRMNSMATLFYILALYLYARGRLARGAGEKSLLFVTAAFAGILALGSKETAATLPFFVFLYEWYFFRDLSPAWLTRQVIPAAMLFAALTLLAVFYLGVNPVDSITGSYGSRSFTLAQRLLTEPRVVLFYLSLLLFPHPGRLNLDHHVIASTGLFSPPSTLFSALALILLLAAAIGTARRWRLVSFAILWYLGNLVIESSFIGLELIFEHRNYLPSMFLILATLTFFRDAVNKPRAQIALLSAAVLLFSFWTFERNKVWRDRITLWSDATAKSPAKARPHSNLGVALKKADRLDEAVFHFSETIRLDPEFYEAYNNLANSYILLGRYEEAIANYRKAIAIKPTHPILHRSLANALYDTWQLEEALLHYRETVRLNPMDLKARQNLTSVERLLRAQRARQKLAPQ